MAFDRFGPRVTVAVLAVPTAVGAMLHGLADTGTQLAVARFIYRDRLRRRFHRQRRAGLALVWPPLLEHDAELADRAELSWVVVLAGTPSAAATDMVGWRFCFVAMGLVAMLVGYLFLMVVHDRPPGSAAALPEPGDKIGALEGLGLVIMTPGLVRLLCMFMAAYAALVTVQVLWTGPYLYDVHGLDTLQRGHVLLGMAVAQILGTLLIGPMDRILNTRKWVVVAAASLTLASLAVLAAIPVSLDVAVGLLFLTSASSAYGSVLYAQIRGLFPDHLAGRGATVGNMAPPARRRAAAHAHGVYPGAVSQRGTGVLPACLSVDLRDAGHLPCHRACHLSHRQGRQAATGPRPRP